MNEIVKKEDTEAREIVHSPSTAKQLSPVEDLQFASVKIQKTHLKEFDKRRKFFKRWLLEQLKEGIHYGFPPGCGLEYNSDGVAVTSEKVNGSWKKVPMNFKQWTPKASLYKAGSLFLVELLRLKHKEESDEITWRMMGEPKGVIVRKCTLYNPNWEELGFGTGSYEIGRKKMNDNSAIKMADKSALTAAIINTVPGCGDLFTQDINDPENLGDFKDKKDRDSVATEFEVWMKESQKWFDVLVKQPGLESLQGTNLTPQHVEYLRKIVAHHTLGTEEEPKNPVEAIEWCKKNVDISLSFDDKGNIASMSWIYSPRRK